MTKYIHTIDVHNTRAAEEIVPWLMKWFQPESVVDVGCGIGTWLYVFKSMGVKNILGIEGEHLNTDLLMIDKNEITFADLEKEFSTDNRFDLAICLEVAEHLVPESSDIFIKSLTKLSDIIIFSAAVPYQGGQNHVNEQWLDYWKSRFRKNNFELADEIRSVFWNNKKIEWWYRQNMLIAFKKDKPLPFMHIIPPLDIIHPDLFMKKNETINTLMNDVNLTTNSNNILSQELERLKHDNLILRENLHQSESMIRNIYKSLSWRIGHSLIKIPAGFLHIFCSVNTFIHKKIMD
ncbi:MAG: class I SAM-dependent methyltransferase [Bacteroidales bacterium]|nr:class I SAM-dependent methyltransferase [Bacteroidales bacterium]